MNRCRCGGFRSRFTKGPLCVECGLLKAWDYDEVARIRFAARHVAGVYANPQLAPNAHEYLVTLTIALDELCDALQMPKFRTNKAEWLVDADV